VLFGMLLPQQQVRVDAAHAEGAGPRCGRLLSALRVGKAQSYGRLQLKKSSA